MRGPNPRLHRKFEVKRLVGEAKPNAEYFVLDVHGDPWAREAVRVYGASAIRDGVTQLGREILDGLDRLASGKSFYPEDY